MSEVEINIVHNFRQTCLKDLKSKEQQLNHIKQKTTKDFQLQSEQKLQQISKILVNLQDELVNSLRQKMKIIVQLEQERISYEITQLQKIMQQIIQSQRDHLAKMIKALQSDNGGGNKVLGKIASGKVQQEWKQFIGRLEGLKINNSQLTFQKQQVQQIVDDIIEILHVHLPQPYQEQVSSMKKSEVLPNNVTKYESKYESNNNQSKNWSINLQESSSSITKNRSKIIQNYSALSGVRSKLNKSKYSDLKNISLISAKQESQKQVSKSAQKQMPKQEEKQEEIQEPEEQKQVEKEAKKDEQVLNDIGTIVVDEYKQTKTIKKLRKIEKKYKQKQKSPDKDIEKIAKLILERKKLLDQLS